MPTARIGSDARPTAISAINQYRDTFEFARVVYGTHELTNS